MIQRIQSYPMVEKFRSLEDVEKYLENLRRCMTEDQYLRNHDIDVDTTGANHWAFKTISGITNNVVAEKMADTLTLASGNATLEILGTTATDTIMWTWKHLGLESLADPGDDRIFFWDDSETAAKWLARGDSISITETTLDTIQDIRTTAIPSFAGVNINSLILAYSGSPSFNAGFGPNWPNRTSGTYNVALGNDAQLALTSGAYNVAVGSSAQRSLTTGLYNLALGSRSQYSLTSGYHNVGIGYRSQFSLSEGFHNCGLGVETQFSMTSGFYNMAMGRYSQYSLTSGFHNIGVGARSGFALTTGEGNTHIGHNAGYGSDPANAPTADTYGVLIGRRANRSVASATVLTNYVGIGNEVLIDKSNQVKIGNSSITETVIYGDVLIPSGKVIKIDDTQVLGSRVIDARLSNTPNSGDATTDDLIDALRDLVISHGLGASS